MTKMYAVYGASGYGREVMPVLENQVAQGSDHDCQFVFIDDNPEADTVNGYAVYRYEDFLNLEAAEKNVSIAIANSRIREKLTTQCTSDGLNIQSVVADNVVQMHEVSIKNGHILSPFVTITSNVVIGESFQANIYSYVAHDCKIGNYVTFAPAVKCNGNITIKDHAYIGTGAIIKQGTPDKPIVIGEGAIVGAGAFVNKDVPDGMTVFGSPAIELTRENLIRRNG